jgi:hypothetical protein
VNICEVATPLELVVSVSVTPGVVVAKVPLAPVPGAVNVTVTPLAGVVPDITVATRVFVNGAPTTALCAPPLVAAIVTVGVVFELELLQPVKRVNAEKTEIEAINARTLQ